MEERESRTVGLTFVLGYSNSEKCEGDKDDQTADRAHGNGIEVYLGSRPECTILVRVELGEGKKEWGMDL